MTQTFDEQLRRTFDLLAEQLRSHVGELSASVEELAAAAELERQTLSATAARTAAEQAEREVSARLNESFARREEQLKEAARAEWFDAGFQQARAEALIVQETRDAEARASVEAAANAAAETAAEQIAAQGAAHRGAFERLVQSVRSLDAATSLSQTLDALAAAAKLESDGAALFLLRGEVLRAWGHAGFDALSGGASFEVPLAEAGATADVVRTGTPQRLGTGVPGRPAFAGSSTSGAFVAVPISMNAQVIGVLCGQQLHPEDQGERLGSTYEILARHAARVLEALTALRLAQLESQPTTMIPASPPQ